MIKLHNWLFILLMIQRVNEDFEISFIEYASAPNFLLHAIKYKLSEVIWSKGKLNTSTISPHSE